MGSAGLSTRGGPNAKRTVGTAEEWAVPMRLHGGEKDDRGRCSRPGSGGDAVAEQLENSGDEPSTEIEKKGYPLMRAHIRGEKAPNRRSSAAETARSADHPSSEHILLRLQRQIGNQAVGRLLRQPGGLTVIQRLSLYNTNWNEVTRIRRSGSGQTGVLFVEDNTPNGLVVKSGGGDLPAEIQVAHAVYQKLGQGKVKAPPIRLATREDREGIVKAIDQKLVATDRQVEDHHGLDAFRDFLKKQFSGPVIFIMGKASGETFENIKKKDEGKARQLLLTPDYIRRLGMAAAIDLFLGNTDRLHALNLGNWMTDTEAENEITLIDNYDRYGPQKFTEDSQRDWKKDLGKYLVPSGWDKFVRDLLSQMKRQQDITFDEGETARFKENFKRGMKDGYNRILSKFAPMIGRRSRTLKKQIRQIQGADKTTRNILDLYDRKDPWEFLKERAAWLRWHK